jgi:hypothetical protein
MAKFGDQVLPKLLQFLVPQGLEFGVGVKPGHCKANRAIELKVFNPGGSDASQVDCHLFKGFTTLHSVICRRRKLVSLLKHGCPSLVKEGDLRSPGLRRVGSNPTPCTLLEIAQLAERGIVDTVV